MPKKKKGGSDSKFFQTTKKGEIHELKSDLNSFDRDKIKDGVKKIIAAMTVGKDVSALFTDVVKNMQTDNIELKKLVYLYIINYARSQPDKAILVVSTFQRDAKDESPLVRALAIRTMGCIRVDRITEYLCEPLAKGLTDRDPYVRKTAAVCVAKLYDINKDLVEEQEFLTKLRSMIADPNPMVVANVVAALAEIAEASGVDVFNINAGLLSKLLAALNECTEWGQVFILDCLAKYEPDSKQAEEIVERVTPRLKHANSAVAMSAVKVIMKYLRYIDNERLERKLITEKLPPPLITLLSEHRSEIQYVALRNINLIVQKVPQILQNNVKHFFCKYNDPIYVKMEKLEIMIKLANRKNVDKVLMELKEYATEVDVEFVRKAVLAIGRCAIKLESAAQRCIKVLLELIETKVNYVVQEAIIVTKDIFRKYPNKYESIIATLCENLDTLDEPEAKASMIWIIGEYADRLDNAPDLLESFVEVFDDENAQVQLQLLTAVVKLFLKRPEDAKEMVTQVLNLATHNSDNPDLRDRGYVYWRLLSTDPEAAQAVVLAARPVIDDDTFQMDQDLLNVLIDNIATLASIYHKPPELFIKDGRTMRLKNADRKADDSDSESESESESDEDSDEDEDESEDESEDDSDAKSQPTPSAGTATTNLFDLGDFMNGGGNSTTNNAGGDGVLDIFGNTAAPPQDPIVLDSNTGKDSRGLVIRAGYGRENKTPVIKLTFQNNSASNIVNYALKFNTNSLGVAPTSALLQGVPQCPPGGSCKYSAPIQASVTPSPQWDPNVQIAIKTDLGVSYFDCPVPAHVLFHEDSNMEKKQFLDLWRAIGDAKEQKLSATTNNYGNVDSLRSKLGEYNLTFIANPKNNPNTVYFSIRYHTVPKAAAVLVEVTLNGAGAGVCCRSSNSSAAHAAARAIVDILGA